MNAIIKYILIIPTLLLVTLSLNAQTIERRVICAAGGHLAPAGGPQLSQNIGETFVATLSGGGYMLTQGFEQPLSSIASVSPCIPTSELIAWYPFTGNANDSSGNGFNGVVHGASLTTDRFGYSNRAYHFNGSHNYIQLPFSQNTNSYTISLWVQPDAFGAERAMMGNDDNNTSARGFWLDASGRPQVHNCHPYPPSSCTHIYADSAVLLSQWSHVVCSVDSGTVTFYVNGHLAGVQMGVESYGTNWMVGIKGVDTVQCPFLGKIDDIAFYSRPLSASEVAQLYSSITSAGTIFGPATVCTGNTTTLSDTVTGGTWSSNNTSVATIGSTGVVTGVSAGTAIISYLVSNSCGSAAATKVVTVNAAPNAGTIIGVSSVCAGSTLMLTDATVGGSWSSSNTFVSTVGSTGVVTGINAGAVTISYIVSNSCGTATATKLITVDPAIGTTVEHWEVKSSIPTAPDLSMYNTVLIDTTIYAVVQRGYGTLFMKYISSTDSWVRIDSIASNTGGGSVSALNGKIYVMGGWSGGCYCAKDSMIEYDPIAHVKAVKAPMPTARSQFSTAVIGNKIYAIGGWPGNFTTLEEYDQTTNTWSTKAPVSVGRCQMRGAVAIGGKLHFIGGGSMSTGYTDHDVYDPVTNSWSSKAPLPSGRCFGSVVVHNGFIYYLGGRQGTAGPADYNTNYRYDTMSDTWSASLDLLQNSYSHGAVSYAGKLFVISETFNNALSQSVELTSITGTYAVCVGSTSTLSNTTIGGAWSSSNMSVAVVGTTGVITGVAGGTSTISYTVTNSCGSAVTTKIVTVNPAPNAGTVTGATSVNAGSTITLSNTVTGGTWSSSNASIATVGSTGIVTGLVTGTVTVSYTVMNSCGSAVATKVVTVNAAVGGITGTLSVCSGSSTALSCATPGGAWSSNNTTIATVTTGGVVSGLSPGVAVITYTVGGSYVTAMLTVNAQPTEITGSRLLCGGSVTTLASMTTGGTWTSMNISVATISATGIVTGLAAGTTVISYTNASSCARTAVVTVNAQPSAITGATSLCPGTTGTLGNSVSGGTWSGGVTTIATINGGGEVTAINTGTTTISYTTTGSCRATVVITVNAAPANITGTMKACPGTTTTLGDATAGGTWSSGNIAVTAIGSATGIVTGVTAGTAIVSYTTGAGCSKTTIVTINPLPTAISGPLAICVGSTSTLTNGTSGLTWSSNNTSVATIGGTNGILTGVSIGTSVISYKSGTTGCYVTAMATVATTPAAISGPSTACPGSSITLSSTTTGGTWSSGNTGIATVDATTGVVTGVSTGIVTISYSLGSGCSRTKQITINASPTPVSGYPLVCVGLTTTLSSVYGTWASGNPSVATVVISGGYVTGVAPGTALMTFTSSPNGCTATYVVTVMPVPAAITGTTSLCSGLTTTLSDATPGGVWSSSNTAGATVGSATGLVTAVGTGTVTISYSFGNTCRATTAFTTRALPAVISGSDTVCATMTTTLSDVTTGGTWSSSNTAIATVGTGISTGYGVVSGVTAGTAAISYTLTSTGCARSKVVTVNACSRPGGNGQPAGGSWQLYPNPTTGTFTVNADEAGVLQVYSLDGREVSHYVIRKMLNELVLPKELASGVYMCRFTGESGTTTIVRLVYER